jgi:hypothetical protein
MSHLSFYHSFRLTDIEQDFGLEKARVRGRAPGRGGWPQGTIAGGDDTGR